MQRIRRAIDVLARELVVVRNNQRVFTELVELYLQRIEFAAEGYAQLIRLPRYRVSEVTIDPDHTFGRPRFVHGGSAVDNVIDWFRAGEPVDAVAEEFALSRDGGRGRDPCRNPSSRLSSSSTAASDAKQSPRPSVLTAGR